MCPRHLRFQSIMALVPDPDAPLKARFEKLDRAVFNYNRSWVPGKIHETDAKSPEDPTGKTKVPYVVKLDPPLNQTIPVMQDANSVVTAERCFGQRKGSLLFTLSCMPTSQTKTRRFSVGDRVACAVEDDTDKYTIWAAGTVAEVNHSVEEVAKTLLPARDWQGAAGIVPYRVELDTGLSVLVHRDEHWLVRDLALQPEGPRQGADGTRDMKRMVKRRVGVSWEYVDHMTRIVRPAEADSDDDDADEAVVGQPTFENKAQAAQPTAVLEPSTAADVP